MQSNNFQNFKSGIVKYCMESYEILNFKLGIFKQKLLNIVRYDSQELVGESFHLNDSND